MSTSYTSAARARAGQASSTISCFDPATLEPLGEVDVCPPDEVTVRVERARLAQLGWARSSFDKRRDMLGKVLDHVLSHADELCRMVVRDAGKTRENAMLGEIWPVCEKLRWTIAHGEKHLETERVSAGLFAHKIATVEYTPRGVVGIITPWNYPLQNVLGPAVPALMAGNAVIIKVSEWTAWSAERIQAIFDEALSAAGVSTDLVQIINGYGDTGAALVSSGVDLVIFTGSVSNGRRVIEQSAQNITPVVLELGGKDAFIVCDDADLEQAAHAAMAGAFIAAGQNCLAAERMFVFDAIYDDFERRVVELASQLRQGPPLGEEVVDVGALVTPAQLDIVENLVNDAVSKGARVLVGGTRRDDGQYFAPTVLADITSDMAIMNEETFGPIMVLVRVADEVEAVSRANDTQFGLGCTIMTKSRSRARRIQRQMNVGNCSINEFALTYMAQDLPFGGIGRSGFGRLNGREGLRACANQKAVLSDRWPLHQPANLYPVGPKDYDIARGVIRTLYTRGIGGKLRAIAELATSLLTKKRS
jgi:acyl-CoA reductase-like NAD-dependent aldehyde dehydrogenase